jgi:hypothetical protein
MGNFERIVFLSAANEMTPLRFKVKDSSMSREKLKLPVVGVEITGTPCANDSIDIVGKTSKHADATAVMSTEWIKR